MNRRGFFGALVGMMATATMDPERLLWRPGAKLISIPRPQSILIKLNGHHFQLGDYVTFMGSSRMWVVTGREANNISIMPHFPLVEPSVWIAS